jgi:hypothetical protein
MDDVDFIFVVGAVSRTMKGGKEHLAKNVGVKIQGLGFVEAEGLCVI